MNDDVGKTREQPDLARRRFARAGLSGTVVLGSLASKPVLGAAPYHCTVSGQASGTLSRQGVLEACRIGDSRTTWLLASDQEWAAVGVTKGSLPSNGCTFGGPTQPTMFNGFTAQGVSLEAAFWGQSGNGSCTLTTIDTGKPASMLQVLNTIGSAGSDAELGSIVVLSLLNALKVPNYGATPAQVIEMFNAVYPTGSYSVAGRTWGRAEVVGYLKLLNNET